VSSPNWNYNPSAPSWETARGVRDWPTSNFSSGLYDRTNSFLSNTAAAIDRRLGEMVSRGRKAPEFNPEEVTKLINENLSKGVGVKKEALPLQVRQYPVDGYDGNAFALETLIDNNKTGSIFFQRNMNVYRPKTLSEFLLNKKPSTSFEAWQNTPGFKKKTDFPFQDYNVFNPVKDPTGKTFNTVNDLYNTGISGEFNKAINEAFKAKGLGNILSGGTGHSKMGEARWRNLVDKGLAEDLGQGYFKLKKQGGPVQLPKMQKAGQYNTLPQRVSINDPRYAELYKNRQVGSFYDGAFTLPDLPEVTVTAPRSYTMDSLRDFTTAALYGAPTSAMKLAMIPQAAMTEGIEALRGKSYDFKNVSPNFGYFGSNQRDLSQTMGYKNPEGFLQNAANVGLSMIDPLSVSGLTGMLRKPLLRKLVNSSSKNFKSEINWAKWNKEIPKNKPLLQEYNAIEQQAKADGTWMKNSDGTPFDGTPEEFVQQNSSNFKKAYPDGAFTTYKGVGAQGRMDDLRDPDGEWTRPFFAGDKNVADVFTSKYHTSKSPIISHNNKKFNPDANPEVHKFIISKSPNSLRVNANSGHWAGFNIPENSIPGLSTITGTPELQRYIRDNALDYITIDDLLEGGGGAAKGTIHIINPRRNNIPKSAIGNNGMFDMTNLNIYKALVPSAIATGAISKQQNGGFIVDPRGQWAHPGKRTIVPTPTGQITMKGVPYPVYGEDETGFGQMMYPGGEYKFPGQMVDEIPMMQFGGISLLGPLSLINAVPKVAKTVGSWFSGSTPATSPKANIVADNPNDPEKIYGKLWNEYTPMSDAFEQQRAKNDMIVVNDPKSIALTSGRFKGAKVSPVLINEAVSAAKSQGIDPWLMLSVIGRESAFGSGADDNVIRAGDKGMLVSGWNVAENYQPYDPMRFLADNKVPGVITSKDAHGWSYEMEDGDAVAKYLTEHPELFTKYKQKISTTPQLGNMDSFDLAAKFLKEKGISRYNPGDTKYPSMVNADMNLLKNDAALRAYMKTLGYKNGGQYGGLDRWFAEKWVDVKTGKACGRQEGESRAGYPACRPSKRVSSETPKTSSEMSSAEKVKFKRTKTSSERIPYNHKK
jgi:hypothetical protein